MVRKPRTVHVAKVTNTVKGVTYTSYYLRRSFRQDGKVKHETLGNLSHLPEHLIELIRRSLKGETFVPAAEVFRVLRTRPHGHVEAILTMIRRLGLDSLIASRPSRPRDLVLSMIAERLLFPCSKLAATRYWQDTTLAAHGDLYARHREGFPCLQIRDGQLALGSLNNAPFGVTPLFEPSRFERQPMPG
jgi:hypothetical protein